MLQPSIGQQTIDGETQHVARRIDDLADVHGILLVDVDELGREEGRGRVRARGTAGRLAAGVVLAGRQVVENSLQSERVDESACVTNLSSVTDTSVRRVRIVGATYVHIHTQS